MTTLHIEHAITDYTTWRAAFDGYASVRAAHGVRAARITQPVDDAHYIVIDLDFDSPEAATSFRQFLRERVWSSTSSAPALLGKAHTAILEPISVAV